MNKSHRADQRTTVFAVLCLLLGLKFGGRLPRRSQTQITLPYAMRSNRSVLLPKEPHSDRVMEMSTYSTATPRAGSPSCEQCHDQ